nr:unnamed protein product [Callosobruchus analis]
MIETRIRIGNEREGNTGNSDNSQSPNNERNSTKKTDESNTHNNSHRRLPNNTNRYRLCDTGPYCTFVVHTDLNVDSLSSIPAPYKPTNHIFSNRIMTNLVEKELLHIVDRLAKFGAITGYNTDNITRRDIISTRKTNMRDQWDDQWRQFCRNSNTAYKGI